MQKSHDVNLNWGLWVSVLYCYCIRALHAFGLFAIQINSLIPLKTVANQSASIANGGPPPVQPTNGGPPPVQPTNGGPPPVGDYSPEDQRFKSKIK